VESFGRECYHPLVVAVANAVFHVLLRQLSNTGVDLVEVVDGKTARLDAIHRNNLSNTNWEAHQQRLPLSQHLKTPPH
jgi:hypothetical protein